MKLSDLHPEDQKLFLEAFTSNPEVIARQDEINSLIADKQFIQAFKAKQELAKFQDEVFQNWVKTIEFRAEKIDVNKSNLPQEVKDKVNMLYVVAFMGCDLIVTDGVSLLGGDDKAGIAEIMTMAETFIKNPSIPHGRIGLAFTPDEEIGKGADYFDV